MEREKWAGESGKATRLKCDDIEGANSRLIFRLEKMGLETGLSPFGKPSTGHRNAQREFSMKSFSFSGPAACTATRVEYAPTTVQNQTTGLCIEVKADGTLMQSTCTGGRSQLFHFDYFNPTRMFGGRLDDAHRGRRPQAVGDRRRQHKRGDRHTGDLAKRPDRWACCVEHRQSRNPWGHQHKGSMPRRAAEPGWQRQRHAWGTAGVGGLRSRRHGVETMSCTPSL